MAFQGSLKELPLPDIIQLVAVSGKTGVFVLENGSQRGEIYLRNGEIYHAAQSGLQGEEAVYELAIWQEGEFVFRPGETVDPHTIKKSNTNLLMEAARRIDEWQVLSKRIPSTRMIPAFVSEGANTSVSFTPQEWSVICKIDERRSIEQLAAALGSSAFEVCKTLYGLVTGGLVELKEDLGQLRSARLENRTAEELSEVVQKLEAHARALLANHERLGEVDSAARRARSEMSAGGGSEIVLGMVRSLEQTVSSALGPNQSRVFLESVNQLLNG